ncbi:Histone-lysine N-methyltransferase SETMAR [Eumeta japonica]|uniref:Histone-lysine N-methyltransferase SETMAR n=1 Tax=Eumeta variegata TaxID=151549 RepID=A0A4C1XHK2_EUMVA|nr:Histone-lysine N-methyltransferase SETMAR [Eumeta japonica]
MFQDELNPTKVIRAKITLKQMIARFFGVNEHMVIVPLEHRKTVNLEWYTTICLPGVFEEMRKNNRQCRIILHHDNASCHTSAETIRFLKNQKIELTSHPPFSPDLDPNDFYLFPSVKMKLRGQCFSSREEAVDALKMHVLEIPQSEWKKCYKNWFQRIQKYIDHHDAVRVDGSRWPRAVAHRRVMYTPRRVKVCTLLLTLILFAEWTARPYKPWGEPSLRIQDAPVIVECDVERTLMWTHDLCYGTRCPDSSNTILSVIGGQ